MAFEKTPNLKQAVDLLEWIEANANLTLWCVHVAGPDDVYAEASHAAAVRRADELNRTTHALISERHPSDNTIMCFAYADIWPWSKERHAESMKEEVEAAAKRRAANVAVTP